MGSPFVPPFNSVCGGCAKTDSGGRSAGYIPHVPGNMYPKIKPSRVSRKGFIFMEGTGLAFMKYVVYIFNTFINLFYEYPAKYPRSINISSIYINSIGTLVA